MAKFSNQFETLASSRCAPWLYDWGRPGEPQDQGVKIVSDQGQFYSVLVEAALEAMVVVNGEGRVLFINNSAEAMFGYKKDEVAGQAVEVFLPARFHALHQVNRGNFFHDPQRRLMGQGREFLARRKSGEEFPVEIGLNPVAVDGQTVVVATIVDISVRRDSDERLRKALRQIEDSNQALETEVRLRTKTLTDTLNLLRNTQDKLIEGERFAAMGRMAAKLAHEVNSPLAAIEAANRITRKSLEDLLVNLTKTLGCSETEIEAIFLDLVASSDRGARPPAFSSKKALAKQLSEQLQSASISLDAAAFDLLLDLGISSFKTGWDPLFRDPNLPTILKLASQVVDISRANSMVDEATARASRFIQSIVEASGLV